MDTDRTGMRDDKAVSWKNWSLTIPQVLFVIAGGYYIYQALIKLWRYPVDRLETPTSSIVLIMIGVALVGLAVVFQEISKYWEKKREILLSSHV